MIVLLTRTGTRTRAVEFMGSVSSACTLEGFVVAEREFPRGFIDAVLPLRLLLPPGEVRETLLLALDIAMNGVQVMGE